MTGAITTLGLGSGLELQNILDQLKEADSSAINSKKAQKTSLQEKIDAYNKVNAKLFNVKSDALSLSLESDFLKTSVSVSDEDILTATANDGIAATSFNLEVTQKAQYNSFQSVGVGSKEAVFYTEPATGITNVDATVTTEATTMEILYGGDEGHETISVDLESGMTLVQIAEAINESSDNKNSEGTALVNASIEKNGDEYYIRVYAAAGGDAGDEKVVVAGFDYVKADATFSIARADDDEPMWISVPPGATYAEAVDRINLATDNPGITAAIIDTGEEENPFRMTLTSDASGEKHRITISANLPLTEKTGAGEESLNAMFTVNGISYQRQSNDGINDVVAGVTLNLKKTGETTVGIQKETETVKENIVSLIENFNELVAIIQGEDGESEETDTEDDSNPFDNDYTASNMLSRLKEVFTTQLNLPSAYDSLADIGLEVNRDGTLKLNEDDLDQALAADPDAVTSLFIGDSDADITGLGKLINDSITDMINTSGVVTTEINEAEAKMTRLDEEIETVTSQLDKRYETMTQSFIRLDTYIRQLNSQSAYMSSMIESFNKTTEK
jgi:flagellar hook-associated protein 2